MIRIAKIFDHNASYKEFHTLKAWYPEVGMKWMTFEIFWAEK